METSRRTKGVTMVDEPAKAPKSGAPRGSSALPTQTPCNDGLAVRAGVH